MSDILKKLQAPFKPDEIEFRVGSTNKEKTKGLALAYVTNRAIQDRLDDIFGVFGWKNEFKEWKDKSQLCGISVFNEGEWITKWDGSDDSNMEATKGGLSDAMKRAAYQWGIGRYLYKLPDSWVPLKAVGDPQKPTYVLEYEPQLPEWALPEGYKYNKPAPKPEPKPESHYPESLGGKPESDKPTCSKCHKEITVAEHDYSAKKFNKPLCRTCQK